MICLSNGTFFHFYPVCTPSFSSCAKYCYNPSRSMNKRCVMLIAGNVHGSDERGRIIRRTLARYLILLQTLTCQAVSTSVRRRFPTLDHIEESGIMTKEERAVFDAIPGSHGKWWAPVCLILINSYHHSSNMTITMITTIITDCLVHNSCRQGPKRGSDQRWYTSTWDPWGVFDYFMTCSFVTIMIVTHIHSGTASV